MRCARAANSTAPRACAAPLNALGALARLQPVAERSEQPLLCPAPDGVPREVSAWRQRRRAALFAAAAVAAVAGPTRAANRDPARD